VLEGFRREVTVNDLCRREGIKPHSYYSCTKEFMEGGKERLARDTVRDATRQQVEQLKRENGELKAAGGRSVTGSVPSQKNGHSDATRRQDHPGGGKPAWNRLSFQEVHYVL
jgi:transposase-like protein